MKKTIIFLLAGFALVVLVQDFLKSKYDAKQPEPRPYVVMLSLDGFRWDYQEFAETPTLDSIQKFGVKATGLQPVFPSKTFPNHYSIATGLYPGNHGLVSNSFFDPKEKDYYSLDNRSTLENGKYYKGEPIWVTAEAQRVTTASYFWVGSEAKIKGYYPTYWKKYDHHFPCYQRADTVISWLQKPYNERPKLITWYLADADDKGHKYGPESEQIKQTIAKLDSIMGYFFDKLNQLEIKDSVNVIIVSDHGMAAIDTQKVVFLEQYLKSEWVDTSLGGNPFIMIQPTKNRIDSVVSVLKTVEGISVWKKADLPERFHLKQSDRVSDVIVLANEGWSIEYKKGSTHYTGGTHGYDNVSPDMNGIFYAIGPNFKQAFNAGQLYNVDIYLVIAKILNIKPAPNDGDPKRIVHVLKD